MKSDNTMHLGEKEKLDLCCMRRWFDTDAHSVMEGFTQSIADVLNSGDPEHLNRALANIKQLKSIFQRVHNFNHTLARLLAKSFLEREFPMLA
jgi:hypothetical protein